MKVVFVTPEFVSDNLLFDGGLANYIYRVSKSLMQMGHTPIVLTRSFDKDEVIDYEGIKVYRKMIIENKVVAIAKTLTSHSMDTALHFQYMSWVFKNELEKIIATEQPDLIQYTSYTGTGFYAIKNIPSTTRISSYEKLHREARGVKNPTKDELRIEWLEAQSLKKVTTVFGPSKLTNAAIKADLNVDVETIETPFLMDVKTFDNSLYEKELQGKKYLLYFGTLSRLKGLVTISEIIFNLLGQNPDLHFVFVGKDDKVKDLIIQNAKEHSSRLKFYEKVHHDQLYPLIKNSEFVVLPSLYDNFPNTCIEAMALSKTVIGTFGTSFEQLIDEGKTGFLVNKANSEELLAKINYVLHIDAKIKAEIEQNAAKIIERLQPEKVVEQLVAFYTTTIQKFNQNK